MTSGEISVSTRKKMELVDITRQINDQVQYSSVKEGFCFLFNLHTTAGLTINEGADPAVQEDIIVGLQKIVPMQYPFKHLEGNSAAHIMSSLVGCSLNMMIENGEIVLGTWQRIFFCEFDGPRSRRLRWRITENT
ncbi:MAG TPA: secondary thiamine-phosphate synthase enzyme YjbQ [Desulfopila sp.]|nr:secondary thiamine-phosphate synthase enzyme YjbQ [Desulfopila sp.]